MPRINPFAPNSAVNPEMFAGRVPQLLALDKALLQTRAEQPKCFMLTGERGIGKTSLLRYFKAVAQGQIDIDSEFVKFLVIDLDVEDGTTCIGLIRRVQRALQRELEKTEPARAFLAKGWEFMQRLEAFGVGMREGKAQEPETLQDDFAHSLAKTVERITHGAAESEFGAKYDGVVLLIDEADNASPELNLGAFVKLTMERLQRHDCSRVMIGLAGLPDLKDVLRESHPSSLRVVDDIPLGTLSKEEVEWVIDRALIRASEVNTEKTTIDAVAKSLLVHFAEGYPHFIQQFGYSAFEADQDGVIDGEDVFRGAFGPMGGLKAIGERYYRDNFYNKIQKDSYRQVLRIMAADSEHKWVSKEQIRKKFKGKNTTLDSAIHALRDRKIIFSKEGERGTYCLQQRGFALWIKMFTTDPSKLQSNMEEVAERTQFESSEEDETSVSTQEQ